MSDAEELAFASEFPAATREQWLKLVDGVLKGAPFDKRLVAKTYDGLAIQPLYARAANVRPVAARTPGAPWTVMQRVDHPDPAAANEQALHDLENGATGLTIVCKGSINANGYGLDSSLETLERVLDGVYLDAGVTIDFNVAAETRDAAKNFAALVKKRGVAPEGVEMRAALNPLGHMAAAGSTIRPWNELAPYFAGLVKQLADDGFRGPFAVADARVIHNAGGSEAQELAFALASAVAYLRALEAGEIALDAARRMIYFRLAADADQFLTVAKFRSIRKLWARVEQACGLAPEPTYLAAESAWRMMTRRDPYVNILRATVAVFAAGLGGADAITVLPFTAAIGMPDRFARRIARNTQLILLEESHLAKVADPAAGSGGIEDLTQQLCEAAWVLFQEIENAGGVAAALEAGLIQNKVAATRAEREKNIARRRDALTGTSEFPDIHETAVHVEDGAPKATPLPDPPPPSGRLRPSSTGYGGREPTEFAALPRIRLAAPFEQLRDTSDRMLEATGARPKVFLANLGKASDFTARTLFAKNFFEAGGIEAVSNDGFADRNDMIAAFKSSGAKLVCLCSSDKVYAAEAADAARALKAMGAAHIYLAGRPGELESALKAAGVQDFIYAGCDVLATSRAAHDILRLRGAESA
ncbi:MAG: methylmalonyl-CoA mutase [Alphaproteobacteria bacterium]|nr:MAG: methylmalonyl-CoA mutase [Alphaproteobacteria bacterium]